MGKPGFICIFCFGIFLALQAAFANAENCGIDDKTINTYAVGTYTWPHQVQSGCSASSAEIELKIKVWTFNDYGVLDLFCSNTTTFDYGSVTTAMGRPGFVKRITRTLAPDSGTYYTISASLNSTHRGWLNDNGVIYFALIGNAYWFPGWPAQFDLSSSVLDTGEIIVLPSIARDPSELTNSILVGETASSQSFDVWNSGPDTLNYTLSDNAGWLSCSPASGSSTGEHDVISVAYNTASLTAGSYSARITITATGAANSPQILPVSLTVTGVTPGISISPASFQTMEFCFPFRSPATTPMGLAFDGNDLWNVDYGTDMIYKLDRSGNVLDSFACPGTYPRGLAFDGTFLWNADSSQNRIYKLDLSGNVMDSFASPGTDPSGLVFDGIYLWNSDYTTDRIYQLDLAGNIIDSFAAPGPNSMGLAFDGACLWNVDSSTDTLYQLDMSGNILSSQPSPGIYPSGLTFDGTNFWHTDYGSDNIYKMDLNGRTIDYFKPPGTNPGGLTSDGEHFWHADATTRRIYQLDRTGNVLFSFDSPGTSPGGMTFGGTCLWQADSGTDRIYRLDFSGNVIDSFSSPGTYPSGLAFDGTHLWHADYNADTIYRMDLSGNILDSFDSPGPVPRDLAFDGTFLWNIDSSTDKVYQLDLAGNILAVFNTFSTNPTGLAFDGKDLWVGDSSADMIRRFYEDPGPLENGSSQKRMFTIESSGDADLLTGALSITGPDAADYTIQNDTCSGQTLAPGVECTVEIEFRPSSAGEKEAVLVVPSDDMDTPVLLVPLDSQVLPFQGDLDRDGDVDGRDLSEFVLHFYPSLLAEFAAGFGR